MHYCRHEREEDPYASGAQNRRENPDRLNRDVVLHDSIRQALRRGYGLPYGGHMGIIGHPYGLGYGGYVGPPFSPYGGHHHGFPGFPGSCGKGIPVPIYTDDYDSDVEVPSAWYFPPSSPPHPHFTTSPMFTSRHPRWSGSSARYNPGLPVPWAGTCQHEHHHIPPRPSMSYVGRRY